MGSFNVVDICHDFPRIIPLPFARSPAAHFRQRRASLFKFPGRGRGVEFVELSESLPGRAAAKGGRSWPQAFRLRRVAGLNGGAIVQALHGLAFEGDEGIRRSDLPGFPG